MLQPLCRYQRSDTEKLDPDPLPIFNPENALLKLSLTSCIPKLIPADKKSVALSLKFQHDERTLTAQEVQQACDRLIALLKNSFGAEVRS